MWLNRTNTLLRPSAVRVDGKPILRPISFSHVQARRSRVSADSLRSVAGNHANNWVSFIWSQVAGTITEQLHTSRFWLIESTVGHTSAQRQPAIKTKLNPTSGHENLGGTSVFDFPSLFCPQRSAAHSTRDASARSPILASSHPNLRTFMLATAPRRWPSITKTVGEFAQAGELQVFGWTIRTSGLVHSPSSQAV